MALMTSKQYVESRAKMNRNIWFQGKKIEDPINDPPTDPLPEVSGGKLRHGPHARV